MRIPRLAALALVAALGLLLLSCESEPEPEPTDPEPDAAAAEETPAEPDAPTAEGEQEAPVFAVDTVRVTYRASVAEGEAEELTVSWDPPRVAVIFEGGRIVHTEETGTIICSAEGQDAGEEDECTRLPNQQQADAQQVIASFVPFFGAAAASPDGIPGAEPADDREVADRTARCFTIRPPEGPDTGGGVAEVCADAETSATLYYSFTEEDGAEQSVEATDVSAPEEGDFEPTGPVTEPEAPADE